MGIVMDAKQKLRPHCRWMIRRDAEMVLGIESVSFDFPWSEEILIQHLREPNIIGMVAEHNGRVVGYMIYTILPKKIHLLNFAVEPKHRRRGVGLALVGCLVGKLSVGNRTRILCTLRESNLQAQLFFKTCGFRAITVMRNYYDDIDEDAYVMQYRYRPGPDEKEQQSNRITRF